jgi:NADH-quinone oxidoreductase subunit E
VTTETADLKQQLRDIIAPLKGRQIVLIPALQAVQENLGYLPPEAFEEIGELANISANTVYGVASFYAQFRFVKPGEHMIKVCLGTACHVCGAGRIVDALERELNIKEGETTEDEKFSFESVRCFGSCALAPVLVVDDEVYGNVTGPGSLEILKKYQQQL